MNNESRTAERQNTTATLLGGEDVSVKKLDGTTETVRIRQLPVNLLGEILVRMDDEAALVELYCDKPKGWAATLALDDYEKLAIRGDQINTDFFARWLQRKIQRQERLVPGLLDRITNAAVSPLPTGSHKSPTLAG